MCKSRAFFSIDPDAIIPGLPEEQRPDFLAEKQKEKERREKRWLKAINKYKSFKGIDNMLRKAKNIDERADLFNFICSTEHGQKLLREKFSPKTNESDFEPGGILDDDEDDGILIEYGCPDI